MGAVFVNIAALVLELNKGKIMNNIKAFPSKIVDYKKSDVHKRTIYSDCNEGMTLLDYFAGQVLIGRTHTNDPEFRKETVKYCYDIAEAMLKEKAKREDNDN